MILGALLGTIPVGTSAQNLPRERVTNWSDAGPRASVPHSEVDVSILECGARSDGSLPSEHAFDDAVLRLAGRPGTILIPAGTYAFTRGIRIPSGVQVRGEGAEKTQLIFDLSGRAEDAITIGADVSNASTLPLALEARFGDRSITLADASHGIKAGDWVVIGLDDTDLVVSDWSRGKVRQIVRVAEIRGNVIGLASPLRMDLPLERSPRVGVGAFTSGASISCLTLERRDATSAQTNLITITNAVECRVTGVAGLRSNFAHVDVRQSANILVRGCTFREAHAYGSGGQGYGVVLQYGSSECLVDNNAFTHLRHSVLLQAGPNGNVISYNSSTDPYWSQILVPTNTAGDMVLHGNWPFYNLFEGNVCQNISIDASHGRNGPGNMFFRNHAQLYGIIMNTTTPSDGQAFIDNDITGTDALMGNYIVVGSNRFERGNRVRGQVLPAGSESLMTPSLYLTGAPEYWSSSLPWPAIGPPVDAVAGTNPAHERSRVMLRTECNGVNNVTDIEGPTSEAAASRLRVYPNPARSTIALSDAAGRIPGVSWKVHAIDGALMAEGRTDAQGTIPVRALPTGMYYLVIDKEPMPLMLSVLH